MSMKMGSLLLLGVLVGRATAQYVELVQYSDDECQESVRSASLAGAFFLGDMQPFGTCIDTAEGIEWYTMIECNEGEVTYNFYTDATCTGETVLNQTVDSSCVSGTTTRCTTEEPNWSWSTSWKLEPTFYADETCDGTDGDTDTPTWNLFTMDLDFDFDSITTVASGLDFGSITSIGDDMCVPTDVMDMNTMVGCIDNTVSLMYFDSSDDTCSFGPVGAVSAFPSCVETPIGVVPYTYMKLECSEVTGDGDGEPSAESGGSSLFLITAYGTYFWSAVVVVAAGVAGDLY